MTPEILIEHVKRHLMMLETDNSNALEVADHIANDANRYLENQADDLAREIQAFRKEPFG